MTDSRMASADDGPPSSDAFGTVGLVIALVGLMFAYMLGLNVTPLLNGVWTDRLHLAPSEAGLVISAQFVVMAVATIVAGRFLGRLRLRPAACAAAIWTIACYVAAGFAVRAGHLILCFGMSGAGIGFQMGMMAALLSHREDADRVYAIAVVIGSSLVAALTIAFASAAAYLTIPMLLGALALVPAMQLLLASFLPSGLPPMRQEKAPGSDRKAPVPPVMVAMIFMQVGGMAVWAFTERVGHKLGLSTATIGTLLAATAVTAIIGAACAARAARLQRRKALALTGLVSFGLSNLTIVLAPSVAVYGIALLMQAFSLTFTLPFLTAIALEEQDGGRTAAYAHGWSMLLGAASPYVAGWLIQTHGFPAIAIYSAVALLLSVIPLMRRRTAASGKNMVGRLHNQR
jgi:MFS family permease